MKSGIRKKQIITILSLVLVSGCFGRKQAPEEVCPRSRYSLERKIESEALLLFFEDPRFKIYKVAQRKSSYDQITADFYRSPSFGLFTPWGEMQARKFIRDYEYYLNKAVKRFNLPRDAVPVISALAGIEYSWGELNPSYSVFNSLYSVYAQIPTHENFALRNIRGLIDGFENPSIKIDAFSPSSFMGAVGYCQLMPMWFTRITRDGLEKKLDLDGDGVFDPFSMPDAIAFFAWYLSENGFRRNPRNAVRLYNGSGPAAEAFADVVMEFAEKIRS